MKPEERLFGEVLVQVKQDYVLAPAGSRRHTMSSRWLHSPANRRGTFLWICTLLEIDPQAVRHQAKLEREAVAAVRTHHSDNTERYVK